MWKMKVNCNLDKNRKVETKFIWKFSKRNHKNFTPVKLLSAPIEKRELNESKSFNKSYYTKNKRDTENIIFKTNSKYFSEKKKRSNYLTSGSKSDQKLTIHTPVFRPRRHLSTFKPKYNKSISECTYL